MTEEEKKIVGKIETKEKAPLSVSKGTRTSEEAPQTTEHERKGKEIVVEAEEKLETSEESKEKAEAAIKTVEKSEGGDNKPALTREQAVRGGRGRYKRPTEREQIEDRLGSWNPKTKLGKEVRAGTIKDLDKILDGRTKILEPEIVDSLGTFSSDLISIGQSKGKFGGGKRRAWRQTQRKTKEGNVPTFSAMAVAGDGKGHIGLGTGKAKETLPSRDKAIRKAKLNVIHVIRGDGSFDSVGGGNSSIPFKVEGKSGSVRVVLTPAAPGTGLVVGDELKKILKLAGIKDIYGKTFGRKRTVFNLAKACIEALKKTNPVYEVRI